MVSLPEHLKQWLDGWGPDLRSRVSSALTAAWRQAGRFCAWGQIAVALRLQSTL